MTTRVEPRALRERGRELELLAGAIEAVRLGSGRLLVIEGPAGIGKTSLLAAACDQGRSAGMRVLRARGSELEGDFSFGVVRQLLEPVLYAAADAERERCFEGAAALARPLFEQELALERPREEEVGFRRRHGLFWLIANMAREGPLVVALDDAQWFDDQSAGFVGHLATRLEHLPVLLVVASRPHEGGLSALLADPSACVLRPGRLSRDALHAWVSEELGATADGAFVAACDHATGGNPFLIGELLREVRSDAIQPSASAVADLRSVSPQGVARSVLQRLAALVPEATALARAATVLGEAELALVAALADVKPDPALEAAAALTRAGVLAPSRRVHFVHPLVRTVLYDELPAAERAVWHARAALVLRDAGAAAEQIAAQLVLAARIGEPWATEALIAAATEASFQGTPEIAARFLQRTLVEVDDDAARFEVLLALGRAEVATGQRGALDRMRDAMAVALTPDQKARAAIKLARVLRYAGGGAEAVKLLQDAQRDLGDEQPGKLSVVIEHELLAASTVSYDARRRLAGQPQRWWAAVQHPPRTSFDRFVYAAQAVEAANQGRPVQDVCDLALASVGVDPGDDHLGRHVRMLAIYSLLLVDRFDRADSMLGDLADAARSRGGAEMLANVSAQRALLASRRGAVLAVQDHAVEALRLVAGVGAPPAFLLTAVGALLLVAVERDEAPHPLAADVRDDGDSLFGRHLRHARATLRIAQGQLEEGVQELLDVGERERAIGWTGPVQFAWRSQAALALETLGEHDHATRLADEELALARATGAARAIGIALHATALLNDGQARRERLEEAVTVFDGSGADLEQARALVDLGTNMRQAHQPAPARQPLRMGYEIATRCGATKLRDRARSELLAAGGRPRRAFLTGPEALTPSELRVARLAAQNLINRDIAQTLFITEKTVESHLGRTYAKLGLTSRRELADALAGDRAQT
ncbi:MAG: AAA family ATPase [Actinomycetota bacterium]|nr:AAA family ATPase [Actinomycetota bacterium]